MIITTTNSIPKIQWQDMEILGLVSGSAVQTKYENKKPTTKSGIYDYIDDVVEARRLAIERMTDEANKLEAEAIIKVEYIKTPLLQGYTEIMVYGTAVRFDKSISDTSKESRLSYEFTEFTNKPTFNGTFLQKNNSDKNILNINSTQEKILKNSAAEYNVKDILEKIRDKNSDLSYELSRVYSNKENIDYIFIEIAEIIILFGQLEYKETVALKNLKTVIDEKISSIEKPPKLKKDIFNRKINL